MEDGDSAEVEGVLERSKFKPRLLFPTKKEPTLLEDEEALTDIEDSTPVQSELEPGTPKTSQNKEVTTPTAPKNAPMSPPETRSTTRFANKVGAQRSDQRRLNEFFSSRSSRSLSSSSPTKRVGEGLAAERPKRTRHA